MDPKQVEEIRAAMGAAMFALMAEYAQLLRRLGCKQLTIYQL
jgi:hypothetical protein